MIPASLVISVNTTAGASTAFRERHDRSIENLEMWFGGDFVREANIFQARKDPPASNASTSRDQRTARPMTASSTGTASSVSGFGLSVCLPMFAQTRLRPQCFGVPAQSIRGSCGLLRPRESTHPVAEDRKSRSPGPHDRRRDVAAGDCDRRVSGIIVGAVAIMKPPVLGGPASRRRVVHRSTQGCDGQ